jgi:hypothetical protein
MAWWLGECYGSVVTAWKLGDGDMGVLLWHGSKVTVVWECCYGMEVR